MLTSAATESDELFASLIHDLRQPLNTIQDSASYLRLVLGDCDELVQEQLRLIERQVDLAAHMLAEASAQLRTRPQRTGTVENFELTKSQTAAVT